MSLFVDMLLANVGQAPLPETKEQQPTYALTGRLVRPYKAGTWRYEMVKQLRQNGYVTALDIARLLGDEKDTALGSHYAIRFVRQRVLKPLRGTVKSPTTRRDLVCYGAGPNAKLEDDASA